MKKFELRVVKSWFSDKYVQFEYKTGWVWKTIKCANEPYLPREKWAMEIYTCILNDGDYIKKMKSDFDSIEKIEFFENSELKKVKEGNEKRKQDKLQHIIDVQNALKNANS